MSTFFTLNTLNSIVLDLTSISRRPSIKDSNTTEGTYLVSEILSPVLTQICPIFQEILYTLQNLNHNPVWFYIIKKSLVSNRLSKYMFSILCSQISIFLCVSVFWYGLFNNIHFRHFSNRVWYRPWLYHGIITTSLRNLNSDWPLENTIICEK